MTEIFIAFMKEAQFTNEMLCAGYTQIREANFSRKGIYFQAFTSLSTGYERIGKMCLLLDYAINNNGNFPDIKYLKTIGHNIEEIYKKLEEIKESYKFNFSYLQNLADPVFENIIKILSRFGCGERYTNIDLLVNAKNYEDPINEWYLNIDNYFLHNHIKQKKVEKIIEQARFCNTLMTDSTSVLFVDETGSEINNMYDMYLRNNINTLVGKYRQLYIYRMSRYFIELLINLEKQIGRKNIEVPDFWEIFKLFNCSDDFAKARKVIK